MSTVSETLHEHNSLYWGRTHARQQETLVDEPKAPDDSKTPTVGIRVPRPMWDAYSRVCARKGRDRTEDLLSHMRRQIELLGDEQDLTDLSDADKELAERRARKGGRPRKAPPAAEPDTPNGQGV